MIQTKPTQNGLERKRVVCPHDCPDTCGIIATVHNGRLVGVAGDPDHPTTRGFLCKKAQRYVEKVYASDRILTPLKRIGEKGQGCFQPISWDEALETIADRFRSLSDTDQAERILPYSSYGSMGILSAESMDRRFFHRLGAARLKRSICSAAGQAGYLYTMRRYIGTDPETVVDSKLIIVWGSNTLNSNIHQWPFIAEARKHGARLIVIDPHRTRTAELADEYLQIQPGTDGALALAMINVIVAEHLYDREYVEQQTIGFKALAQRALEYPPERVAAITGLDAAAIRGLAHIYATTRPAFLRIGMGLQRHSNGGMTLRAISCLPALIGSWRVRGGGALYSNSGAFPFDSQTLERPDLAYSDREAPKLVQPKPRTFNMNQLGQALLDAEPSVLALYIYNTNPAAIAPHQSRVLAGLRRTDLFTVVHEIHMTDTARYADIVLPAPTQFEQIDVFGSYWHRYIQMNDPAITPLGEAQSNFQVFRLLAERMGFIEPCFRDTEEDVIRQAIAKHPNFAGITLERLRQEGWVRMNGPELPFAEPTVGPGGKLAFYSEAMAGQGLDPLPVYQPPAESPDGSQNLHQRYPLMLLTPASLHFLNSSFANVPSLVRDQQRPTIELHPTDAQTRGIADGDFVRVWNDRGAFWAYAVVGDTVRPGVACAVSVWWGSASPGGVGCNQTTPDRLSDLGQGATFFSNLVQVEQASGPINEPINGKNAPLSRDQRDCGTPAVPKTPACQPR